MSIKTMQGKKYRIMTNGHIFWIQEKGMLWGWNDVCYMVAFRISHRKEFKTYENAKIWVVGLNKLAEVNNLSQTVVSYH